MAENVKVAVRVRPFVSFMKKNILKVLYGSKYNVFIHCTSITYMLMIACSGVAFYQPTMGFTRPLVVGYFTHYIA